MQQVEAAGGVLAAIESGLIQRQIADSAYRESRRIESGDQVVVGVNRFQAEEDVRPELLRVSEEVLQRQVARLARVRAERDNDAVERALGRLRRAAGGTENLMPHVLEAVRAYGTIGEICDTLRAVFGVYRPPAGL